MELNAQLRHRCQPLHDRRRPLPRPRVDEMHHLFEQVRLLVVQRGRCDPNLAELRVDNRAHGPQLDMRVIRLCQICSCTRRGRIANLASEQLQEDDAEGVGVQAVGDVAMLLVLRRHVSVGTDDAASLCVRIDSAVLARLRSLAHSTCTNRTRG